MRCLHQLGLSLVLLVGCGSVKTGELADAPPAIDAGVTRGTVNVTVLDPGGTGAPAVGANVVFIDPDGTLVKRVATDSQGKANAEVLPGASVTSVALINNQYQLQTVLAVKPGDNLILGSKNGDFTTAGTFTVNYPAYNGAAYYTISTPCGAVTAAPPAAGQPPVTSYKFTLNNSCKQDTMEIVVTPVDANFAPLATISKANVPYVDGGTTTISGAYSGTRTFTASYTNVNPIITTLTLTRSVPDGLGVSTYLSQATPTPTQVLKLSGGIGSNARVVSRFSLDTREFQEVRQMLDGSAATYGLDAGAKLLPWIKQPTFDAATSKLVIPLDTTGTSTTKPDVFRVFASYSRIDPNMQTKTVYSWTLFAAETGDITLPSLPAEVGDVLPTAADTVSVSAIMLEADTISGYDAIRNDLNAAMALYAGSRPPASTVHLNSSPLNLRK